jgi:hypothetical protein
MGDDLKRFDAPTALSRRNLFEFAGLGLLAAAAPGNKLLASPPGDAVGAHLHLSSVMDRLSAYMSEAATRALPDEVAERTKQHVLDTLAAMISGSELPPGRAALRFSREYGGKEVATVVAANFLCGPIEAALTNGMLAHADETDDSHSPSQSHPGCAVVPAALAAGGALWNQRRPLPAGGGARLRYWNAIHDDIGRPALRSGEPLEHA